MKNMAKKHDWEFCPHCNRLIEMTGTDCGPIVT